MPISFLNRRVVAGTFVLGLATILFLHAAPTPAETTLAETPGTEMHVYRDGNPEPMRLFVVMPEGWNADELVNSSTAVTFRDKMVKNGNSCELVTISGGSHGFSTDQPEWKTKVREKITGFLTQQKFITTGE